MELLSIGMAPEGEQAVWKLSRCLSEAFAPLTMEPGLPSLHWDIDTERQEVVCHASASTYSSGEHREKLCRQTSLGVAEYIINELEPETLRRIIHRYCDAHNAEELQMIESYCAQVINGQSTEAESILERQKRKMVVARETEAFLMGHGRLHLQGFLTFRLNSYRAVLREIVQYAVDEYVLEKQYQDFLTLLRYFVSLQEPRLPVVHLVHEDETSFRLYDNAFEPLEYQAPDRTLTGLLETEMQADDRVVSSLIAASPLRIIIHTSEPELQIFNTIESIFIDRVERCDNCRLHRQLTDSRT
ncbi:hypothetical protein PA598K_01544 [Paenibacillus sp. 598K]|uniref:putative sporulation protein YtxC n=1 Tax=Paenibacillus sp. 598K TaxID=1117987 RepID=UPI000FFA72E8|nr:putative sporulation protein YtxC [Paenibacillus sp. 598K]GBF73259.1 hypothetical protein PA598K_01544 [Paenibacillus sp. 598K]